MVATAGCGGPRVSPIDSGVSRDAGVVEDVAVLEPQPDVLEPGPDVAADTSEQDAPVVVDAGDGAARCAGRPSLLGRPSIVLMSGGRMRTAALFLPAGYDPTRAYPVILGFHGYTESPVAFARVSALDRRGPARGYLTIMPEGVSTGFNAGNCCGTTVASGVDDVRYVRDLLAWLRDNACVDPRRIYATGFSNGGMLSHRLACEMADEIAAIAPTAGMLVLDRCAPSRPISVMHAHGTADVVVPYLGSPLLRFPPVLDVMRDWAARNGCQAVPEEFFNRGDARCVRYPRCRDGVETIRCDVTNGGHTWPGGMNLPIAGYTSRDLDSTAVILDFFDRHALR